MRSIYKHLYALVIVMGMAIAIIPVNNAMAMISVDEPWVRQSSVLSNAMNITPNTWDYTYTVYNGSTGVLGIMPVIVDWELPWFEDAGIKSIKSPDGWDYTIETIGVANSDTGWDGTALWQTPGDPLYQGPGSPFTHVTQVLHWYNIKWAETRLSSTVVLDADAIYPAADPSGRQTFLGGFGFTAIYGTTAAPYQASWAELPLRTGDPDYPLGGVPASPDTLRTVPEPAIMLLLGLGLMGLAGIRRNLKG